MSSTNGTIPDTWATAQIGDVLSPLDDGKILHHGWSPQCEKEPSPSDDEWGVLKTTAVQPGSFEPIHNKRLPDKLEPRPRLEVHEGDLLLTCAGPRSRCGVPTLVRSTRPRLILSGKMYRFRVAPEFIEPRFLEAFLLAPDTQNAIDAIKTGISDSGLNLTHGRFRRLEVRLAPRVEQTRIADRIDELFSDLNSGVEALRRVRRKLDRYRAAVLHAAVTGRLSARWREEHAADTEPAADLLTRILKARREYWEAETLRKYEAKGKTPPKGWRERYIQPPEPNQAALPLLPTNWQWAAALQVCPSIQNGNTPPAEQMNRGVGEVPFIKVYNLTKTGHLDFTVDPTFISRDTHQHSLARSVVYPNDILMNIVGPPLGKVSLVPDDFPEWNINQAVVAYRPGPGLFPSYLTLCLLSEAVLRPLLKTAKATAGQFNLSVNNSRALPLPLPPTQEQHVIVEESGRLLSLIDSLESEVDRTLRRSGRLRQSILKAAFEGKLVPQDPADEPASALLARLRTKAESDKAGPMGRTKKAGSKRASAKNSASDSRREATDTDSPLRSQH